MACLHKYIVNIMQSEEQKIAVKQQRLAHTMDKELANQMYLFNNDQCKLFSHDS